jgi:hypothetical protein
VAAERVAATVAQGVHGRRRVGQGDSFWQYRPFLAGVFCSCGGSYEVASPLQVGCLIQLP